MKPILCLFALLGCIFLGCAQPAPRIAPLLDGMGAHAHPISTDDTLAQRYFNQGLALAYGFNHAEALRSFEQAALLDPECAMCYWGQAYVQGPNYNAGMEADAVKPAFEAIQQALALLEHATERERGYIEAMAQRYGPEPLDDRTPLDRAYADALAELTARYPDDDDAATLYAEALMDLQPWALWAKDGTAQPGTAEILAALERAIALNPQNPGANHLYIHATEASPEPVRGVGAADRLGALVPGAGHLVHMPSHTYIRVGRYQDAVAANEQATLADEAYVTQCHAQGLYPVAYMPHNHHFLWAAASLGGTSQKALSAADHMAMQTDQDLMREPGYGTLQHFWVTPMFARVRFGKWDEILALPAPAEDLVYPTGVWHYARGVAFARKGQIEEARQALQHVAAAAADATLETVTVWDINTTAAVMKIAHAVLAGEVAAAQGDFKAAVMHLRKGVALEDDLNYDEPSTWHHPVRQILGDVLLKAGRPAEAEAVYREDLKRLPDNGWALYGLTQCLKAQGKTSAAQTTQQQFETAWQHADVQLTASRF